MSVGVSTHHVLALAAYAGIRTCFYAHCAFAISRLFQTVRQDVENSRLFWAFPCARTDLFYVFYLRVSPSGQPRQLSETSRGLSISRVISTSLW